jgi:hypothetical protein
MHTRIEMGFHTLVKSAYFGPSHERLGMPHNP